jgi:hypothetical protein
MKSFLTLLFRTLLLIMLALLAAPCFAQDEAAKPIDPAIKQAAEKLPNDQPKATPQTAVTEPMTAPAGQPSEADMMKQMMELSKLNENHKLLETMAGSWTNNVTMWMNPDPSAPPIKSTGTAVRKPIMGGRYFRADFVGKIPMPGADGKMKDVDFNGMSIEGYDNAKKKFVATWIDNMGTGIMFMEGTYDPAAKAFTYTAEAEMMPGMKTKVREVVTLVDANHHKLEWFEDRGGKEVKTMEINYTRKK